MGFFEDELSSLADADALRFAGGGFAQDRFGTVLGAVKRRRAARAAGVGGVSVVGASALAVGAVHLPWSSMGLGFDPSAGTVVCTTTTPDGTADYPTSAPDGSQVAIVDRRDGEVTFVGLANGGAVAWNDEGHEVPLVTREGFDNYSTLALAAGGQVVVRIEGDRVSAVAADDQVIPMDVSAYLLAVTNGPGGDGVELAKLADPGTSDVEGGTPAKGTWIVQDDGGAELGRLVLGTTTLSLATTNGVQTIPLRDDTRPYLYDLPSGGAAAFTVHDREVSVVDPGTFPLADDPVTSCVTVTPAPSKSASASASPEQSAAYVADSEATTSVPSWALDPAIVPSDSPFQCGARLDGNHETEAIRVDPIALLAAADVNAELKAFYEDGVPPQAHGSDPVLRASIVYVSPQSLVPEGRSGAITRFDPVAWVENQTDPTVAPLDVIGFTFVAVADGEVVGIVGENKPNEIPAVEVNLVFDETLTLLNPEGAFAMCAGYTAADAWETYVVAGFVPIDESGAMGQPSYAWAKAAE